MEDPPRFSLEEFGTITGLNCGSFPDGYEAPDHNRKDANKQRGAHKDPLWQKIVGKYDNITITDLADELEHDHQMDEWRRIRLALIIILDGVLIASQQIHRPTLRYVQMLDDVDAFLEFPWGRESFLHTIRCMKPPKVEKGKPVDSPVDMLVLKLKQETFRLTGFPLALQLLAFRAIPLLLSKISAPLNDQTIMDLTKPNLSNHPSIELDAVLQVEVNPSLLVTPLIPLIANNHCFSKAMWPGGDCSEPAFTFTPIPEQPVQKKHTVPRKRKESTLKPHKASKETSVHTEQRHSTRLQASSTPTPAPSNELLEARISTLEANATIMVGKITGLEATVAKLGASNKRLKQKLHRKRKRSRATSLLPQFVVTHRRRSAPQPQQTNDLHVNDHHDSPNSKRRKTKQVSDGILGSGSLILSQYHPPSPDHNSPLPAISLAQHSPIKKTSTEVSPLFTALTSPKHPLPPPTALSSQGRLSQQYAPIGTLPQFDATPLNKPTSQSSPSHGLTLPEPDSAPPVYDSSALPYSPIPLFNPTLAATTSPTISPNPLFTPPPALTTTPTSSPNKPAGFSTHYSTPNAFAATATLKGSTSRLIYQDPNKEHGVVEASDSSLDKTVRRVVDELKAQTTDQEVCELSDSSPAKKTKDHQPFHVTPSKLDFSNQFLLQLATPSQWTDSLHMAVLMHMLDMHHKDVLQMENATFMPPILTSLMQSKDRQFQAVVKKDKIRHWVGLAINLRAGHVDVLDSLPSLYDEEDVQRFLRPILQMLPYLIRYVVKNNSRDLSPFTCQRKTGTYVNTRSGDCGPVCAKFMELHLYGDPFPHMSGLTEDIVDKVRRQYAMEEYKTIVLPAYY
ncbi:hypothetical protein HID58_055548 [Brassica napus]|uniref:Ubiquitin-like protease family profile domain-containing protein n=1 Tax=Brassica napus TaxID=3708 RepID=A0ABQ8AKP7_BRANA|nr:hypothetical protein HID58_055548 [Brassica napus]